MSVAWLEQRSVAYLVSSAALALMLAASWQWLPGPPSPPARMRLFMHDVLTDPGATAVRVVICERLGADGSRR